MSDLWPAKSLRHSGRHWLFTAITMPLAPVLLTVAVQQNGRWHACVASHESPEGPCAAPYSWMVLATVGFWALAITTAVTGMVVGVVERGARRRFAHGRWISMSVVGLCAPWALLTYALGHGLGRLLTVRRPSSAPYGWLEAVQLYAALAGGQQPQTVFAPDLRITDGVYMDAQLRYSRYYAVNVTYQPGGLVAVGSPGFVAGAAIGRLIGTSIGYARAASLSRRHWRGHRPARVVVTATTTWCQVSGRWLAFDHTSVVDYQLVADNCCILTFPDVVPMRLHGPSAWGHAVLFAYLRYGPRAWQSAPFLHPVRQAVQQLTNAST